MAKRDLIKYYLQCTKQYKALNDTLVDLEKAYEDGKVTQEQVEQWKPMVESMFDNCQKLAYAVYLLNLPTFSFKRAKESVKAHKLKEYFQSIKVDKDTIMIEHDHVLDMLQETLERLKDNG